MKHALQFADTACKRVCRLTVKNECQRDAAPAATSAFAPRAPRRLPLQLLLMARCCKE